MKAPTGTPKIKQGVALRYPTGPGHDLGRLHVCIVVTDEDVAGDVLLVPICSFHNKADTTCVLDETSGVPRVIHKSYAAYHDMKRTRVATIEDLLRSANVTYLGVIGGLTYSKVKDGVLKSDETIPKFQTYFKQAHGIKETGRVLRSL